MTGVEWYMDRLREIADRAHAHAAVWEDEQFHWVESRLSRRATCRTCGKSQYVEVWFEET